MDTDVMLNDRDRQVIATIERLRERHHACTAAAVAVNLKISRAYMSDVMHDMIERGLLVFEAEMPGSLRVAEKVRHQLFPAETTADRDVCDEPGCDWPNQAALTAHQRKHRS